ncbi:MAG TPA: hypothetical protein VJ851_15690 [Jatrophihabitans sp.]|nr:hypothetical protein [Jatrophihabitans sp.]
MTATVPGRPPDDELEACLRSAPPLIDDSIRCARLTGTDLNAAVRRARAEFDRQIRAHLAFARPGLQDQRSPEP